MASCLSPTPRRSGISRSGKPPSRRLQLPPSPRSGGVSASRRLQLPPSRLTSHAASRRLQLSASPTPSLTPHQSGGVVSASPTPGVSNSLPHASPVRRRLGVSNSLPHASPVGRRCRLGVSNSRRLQLTASPTPSPNGTKDSPKRDRHSPDLAPASPKRDQSTLTARFQLPHAIRA
ncbi:hypothetical protein Syun_027152 [Stephania yunnanensis]|uniref:Uncharacterized protein n=1 Tax=Stephania yunnanensis TaxID=152371 RepID=A0AAP0EF62_9MAGN